MEGRGRGVDGESRKRRRQRSKRGDKIKKYRSIKKQRGDAERSRKQDCGGGKGGMTNKINHRGDGDKVGK